VSADADPPPEGRPLGRRAFLGALGLGATSLLWGDKALQLFQNATNELPVSVRAAVPIGGQWRIYAVNLPYPRYDEASWTLTIDGLVDHPQRLSMADLRHLKLVEQTSDFHCVTGWSVLGVKWRGVRFTDLLSLAGVKPGATALQFTSAEVPYVDTLTLEQLKAPDAMVAFDMDGRPLKQEHGAPARVVMPRMYGYKGVKWLNRITVVDRITDGYWEQRGYSRDAYLES
jgi:DMSO/TMAO reductase YedYZ molybdopterin-dependent catalytic subunit